MKKQSWTGVLAFALWICSFSAASALELVYPADGTYVSRSSYLVIKGGGSPPLDGVTIEINGIRSDLFDISSEQYKASFGDFLIVEPDLDPGNNLIVIVGYDEGQVVARAEATVYFVKDTIDIPEKYRPGVMHLPEREAHCVGCHKMKPTAAELKGDSAATSPCGSCHARRMYRKHVHGPAGVYQCTWCHDPNSTPDKYQVKAQTDVAMCGECHDDKLVEMRKSAFVHGPIEAGLCLVCHDAHATDYPAQLLMPVNDLCLSCHEQVAKEVHVLTGFDKKGSHPLADKADPTDPKRKLSCVSCHNPHSGTGESMFVRGISNRMLLCKECHKK